MASATIRAALPTYDPDSARHGNVQAVLHHHKPSGHRRTFPPMTRDVIPQKLARLHSAAERLRQKASGIIAADPRLQLHLAVTEAAMELADILLQFNSSDENLKVP
jgi:hypothetical protein